MRILDKECSEVLKNHKEQTNFNCNRLDRHHEEINSAMSAIKQLKRHVNRLEEKMKKQEETIDVLEGVVENQQVDIACFRHWGQVVVSLVRTLQTHHKEMDNVPTKNLSGTSQTHSEFHKPI